MGAYFVMVEVLMNLNKTDRRILIQYLSMLYPFLDLFSSLLRDPSDYFTLDLFSAAETLDAIGYEYLVWLDCNKLCNNVFYFNIS